MIKTRHYTFVCYHCRAVMEVRLPEDSPDPVCVNCGNPDLWVKEVHE